MVDRPRGHRAARSLVAAERGAQRGLPLSDECELSRCRRQPISPSRSWPCRRAPARCSRPARPSRSVPARGPGAMRFPIETKPGHAGITPALSLTYSTHAGAASPAWDGPWVWPAIERRTDKGLPSFDDQVDTFTLQSDELLPVGGDVLRLPDREPRSARIRHVREGGRNFWVVTRARWNAGVLWTGAGSSPARWGDGLPPGTSARTQDANGNEVTYAYHRGTPPPETCGSARWSGPVATACRWSTRGAPIRSGPSGRGSSTCSSTGSARSQVEVQTGSTAAYHAYRTYDLGYAQSALTGRSLLTEVAITGINPDGSRHELPPLRFGYATAGARPADMALARRGAAGWVAAGWQHHPGSSVERADSPTSWRRRAPAIGCGRIWATGSSARPEASRLARPGAARARRAPSSRT